MLIWKRGMTRKRLELNGSISFVRALCPLDIYPNAHTFPKSKTDLGETALWEFSARHARHYPFFKAFSSGLGLELISTNCTCT
jgi:hypothetical protein